MQVIPVPAEQDLDRRVQVAERRRERKLHAAPDRRLRVLERDLQLDALPDRELRARRGKCLHRTGHVLRLGMAARAHLGESFRDVVVAVNRVPDAAQGLIGPSLMERRRGGLGAHPLPVRARRLRPLPHREQEHAGVTRRVRPGVVARDLARQATRLPGHFREFSATTRSRDGLSRGGQDFPTMSAGSRASSQAIGEHLRSPAETFAALL
jgi:hypothetical protein